MKTNVTKRICAAAAALMMLSCTACANSDSSSESEKEKETTTTTTAKTNEEKASSDSNESSGDGSELIKSLTDKIKELSNRLDDLEENGNFDFDEDIHEVYDDTAVVEAYKKKDPSGLTDSKDKYIYDCLVKAVDEIIEDGMTDYEKELAVYNYMFDATRYSYENLNPIDLDDEEDWSHTPYGFFTTGQTICVGNATTFKLFMDVLGIDCEIIHSTEEGEHAWNIVKIDGDWYHVDLTFDNGDKHPLYSNFNVTDALKMEMSYPWNIEDFHECTSTKYNYMVMHAVDCDDIYALPKMLKDTLEKAENVLYVTLKNEDSTELYSTISELSDIYYAIESDRYSITAGEPLFNDDYTEATLAIEITDITEIDDDDYPDYPEETIDIDKLADAFNDAFDGEITISDGRYYWDW